MKFDAPPVARAAVQALAASKIRELYNEGIGRKNILAFWVGEPDEPTPEFIRKAAVESIGAGELLYTHNLAVLPNASHPTGFSQSGLASRRRLRVEMEPSPCLECMNAP